MEGVQVVGIETIHQLCLEGVQVVAVETIHQLCLEGVQVVGVETILPLFPDLCFSPVSLRGSGVCHVGGGVVKTILVRPLQHFISGILLRLGVHEFESEMAHLAKHNIFCCYSISFCIRTCPHFGLLPCESYTQTTFAFMIRIMMKCISPPVALLAANSLSLYC